MRRRGLRIALGLAALGLVPMAGCGAGSGEKTIKASTEPAPVPVTVAPLERKPVVRTVEVVGTLKGWEEVTIGAKRAGRVIKVLHDMGDRVKPGALLVELETVAAELAIRQAERQLQAELAKLGLKELPKGEFDVRSLPAVVQAQVALEKAKQILAREKMLIQRGAGTQENFQNAENDERGAEAALANTILTAQSTLANTQAFRVVIDLAIQQRRDAEVRAPVPSTSPEGVTEPVMFALVKRQVSEGQVLKAGDAVVDLVVENPLRLWVNVPEAHVSEIELGQTVQIRVASHPGREFAGKVARINPAVDPTSRTFQVEASVPNSLGMLRPGGFAKASIVTERQGRAAVAPIESIVRFAGVTKLFVVEGGKARAINVETGLEGKGWIEVIGPLPDAGWVVTTGQTQLADGTAVAVRKSGTKTAAPGQ